jgi:hypothetical protein
LRFWRLPILLLFYWLLPLSFGRVLLFFGGGGWGWSLNFFAFPGGCLGTWASRSFLPAILLSRASTLRFFPHFPLGRFGRYYFQLLLGVLADYGVARLVTIFLAVEIP